MARAILLGFGVTPKTEIIVRGTFYEMKTPGLLAGSVEGSDLFMQLEPYKEYGVELGYRFYLAWRTRMKSFIAPVAGVRWLDRILIESAFAPDRNSAIFNVPLYRASTVFTFGRHPPRDRRRRRQPLPVDRAGNHRRARGVVRRFRGN